MKKLLLMSGLLVVAIGVVTVTGVAKMATLSELLHAMHANNLVPIADTANANMQAIYANRYLYQYIIESEKAGMDAIARDMESSYKRFDELIKKYEATYLTPKEKELLARMKESWATYLVLAKKVMAYSYEGQNDKAMRVMQGEAKPVFQKADDLLSEIVDVNVALGAQAEADAAMTYSNARSLLLIVSLIGAVGGLLTALYTSKRISRNVQDSLTVVEKMAAGDLTARVASEDEDEIGRLCQSLNKTAASFQSAIKDIATNTQALATTAAQLKSVSQQMTHNSSETARSAGTVSAATEEVSRNLGGVASATEEMSAAVKEIAQSASEAARVTGDAVRMAKTTNEIVDQLGASSSEINGVVSVITSIAEQTNLLALNATIEAARAGEAGKGFAVVANEVKELARQTAQATDDIGKRISLMLGNVNQGVSAIGEIGGAIERINSIVSTIAAAVEEQNVTTNELGRNISEVSQGGAEIAQNISGVAQNAESAATGAAQSSSSAQELAAMATQLGTLVAQFKY